MGGMANKDWTDALLDRLAATRTRKEIEAYQVTARISRIALHIARHQEEVFGRFGLNRGEVGVLGALLLAGSGQQLSPTQLFKGLMLSSAGITSRLDRLERRGYVKRSRHPSDRRGVLVNLTVAGNKVFFVPNGRYVAKLSVLKALGDESNPAHWETWTSPVITIARP